MAKTKKRSVCVFIGARANYGTARSIMREIKRHPKLSLEIVAGASAILDRYGEVAELMKKDGFTADVRVPMVLEGSTPVTMAKTTGFGLSELATAFDNVKPDMVLVIGDRHEVLSAAVAAAYMNIPVAHVMGGEVSGTIDESVRHAITKLAHVHFPASEDARRRIIRMGEDPKMVFRVGCPRMDEVRNILAKKTLPPAFIGVGAKVDIKKPFLFVSQHPVTTEYGKGEAQIQETLKALQALKMPTIMLWPNADAGSDQIAQGIRKFREKHLDVFPFHVFKNLPMDDYFQIMQRTACMIGNSSSLVREGSFIGTPGVLIGTRQQNRESGKNVIRVGYKAAEIVKAVKRQLKHGPYKNDQLYGDGKAGKRIADILARVNPAIQKTFHD